MLLAQCGKPLWHDRLRRDNVGDPGYVPAEIRSTTGQSETRNAMIKFYQLEGKTLCFLIGSKEKGVVD